MNKTLVTVTEAAKTLGVSRRTMYNYIKKGLPTYPDKMIMINLDEAKEYVKPKELVLEFPIGYQGEVKTCSKCGCSYPANTEFFSKATTNKDGLQYWCRHCCAQSTKQYREKNPTYFKEWYENNTTQQLINVHNGKADKLGLPHNITQESWNYTLKHFDYKCAYCGSTEELEMEHVIPESKGGGFIKENIVCSCHSCNKVKYNKMLDEWYNENNDNYSANNYQKILNYIELMKLR